MPSRKSFSNHSHMRSTHQADERLVTFLSSRPIANLKEAQSSGLEVNTTNLTLQDQSGLSTPFDLTTRPIIILRSNTTCLISAQSATPTPQDENPLPNNPQYKLQPLLPKLTRPTPIPPTSPSKSAPRHKNHPISSFTDIITASKIRAWI